jgi:hypothetical protein
MRWPKVQFTVRRLMVAVALFSVLFLLGAPLTASNRPLQIQDATMDCLPVH